MDKKKLIQDKLILQLDHHLTGLKEKIMQDFSKKSFEQEVASLKSDPIYPKFNLSSEEYALIRLMGRVSISIGRRLGEIYDKIPRLIAQKAFNISEERIAPKMGGKLELDTCLPFDAISDLDKRHIENTVSSFTKKKYSNGAGIEVRYNFNPNDSSRLRMSRPMYPRPPYSQ
ncbi:MAG: hypothetical protein ACE5JB_16350, partial [bacterium]